jgi:hypothetical protein
MGKEGVDRREVLHLDVGVEGMTHTQSAPDAGQVWVIMAEC